MFVAITMVMLGGSLMLLRNVARSMPQGQGARSSRLDRYMAEAAFWYGETEAT